jgi:raffinose/stachyose/melibiose transport system permease protein
VTRAAKSFFTTARRVLLRSPAHVILILFLLIELFPLYFLLINVFKSQMQFAQSQLAFPTSFQLKNFIDAWVTGSFLSAFKNSIILTVSGTFGRLFFGSLAAFALARMRFKGRSFFYYLFLGSMFLPPIVVTIPLFRTMVTVGLINTYIAPIIIYIGYLPFTTFVLTTFFQGVSQELIDAAKIDGCGDFQTFIRIVLPLSTSALASIGILNIRGIWNDFLFPLLFMSKEAMYTLMVRIVNFQGRFVTNLPVMLAGLVISIAPILVLFICFQRYFTKGITLGSFR